MKIVFIAGPYRGVDAWEVAENIRRAERVGFVVASVAGVMPLIPHANTAHFDGTMTDEFWLAGTQELLRRCDAIVMVDGWQSSSGSIAELAQARADGMAVFFAADERKRNWRGLIEWASTCPS